MTSGSSEGKLGGAEQSARGCHRFQAWIALGAALGIGLSAAAAGALTIGGGAGIPVNPVYFNSGGAFGLVASPGFDFTANASSDWVLTGSGGALSVQTHLLTPVLQNPQFPADSTNPSGPQGKPSTTNPFVADSLWTVTNTTRTALHNAYLVFESVDLAPTSLVPGGYPNVPVGIDKNLFSIVEYTDPGAKAPLFFGALSLGALAANGSPGDSTQIRVRYIVAGDLPLNGANLVMPPLTVAGLLNVPEPSTLVLLGSGVVLLAAAGRRLCA